MRENFLILKATVSSEILIICNFNENKKNSFSLEKYKPNSESSKVIMDINKDLNIDNSLILNTMSNLNTMSYITSLNINICESRTNSQNQLDSSSISSDQSSLSSVNLIESMHGVFADKLISYIIITCI